LYDARDVLHHIPFALECLQEGWDPQTYDGTSMAPSDDRQRVQVGMETNRADMKAPLSRCRTVCNLSLNTFCAKLIDHFDNMIKWHQLRNFKHFCMVCHPLLLRLNYQRQSKEAALMSSCICFVFTHFNVNDVFLYSLKTHCDPLYLTEPQLRLLLLLSMRQL
jgi:hypothetical protein